LKERSILIDRHFAKLVTRKIKGTLSKRDEDFLTLLESWVRMMGVTKPLDGRPWDKDANQFRCSRVTFYDENEWRYIPDLRRERPLQYLWSGSYSDRAKKSEDDKQLQKTVKLTFAPEDVKYLIVEKEENIEEFVSVINGLRPRLHNTTKLKLLTRILTLEQIRQDF
jgi:hypothetical protein